MSTVFHVLYIHTEKQFDSLTIGTQLKQTLRPPQTIITADHPWPWVRGTRFCISRETTAATPLHRDVGPALIRGRGRISTRCRKHRLHLPAYLTPLIPSYRAM
jgi:hypothetical protein